MLKKNLSSVVDDSLNNTQAKLLLFCFTVFIISRYFFFLEYSFIVNNLLHNNTTLISNIWRWDSGNYAGIALNGYENTYRLGGNYVWMPLWPLILKIFSLNGFFPLPQTGILINQILLFVSFIVFYNYLKQLKFTEIDRQYGVILLAFAPTNIYFFAGLTESLFLLLSLIGFYCLEKEKFWTAVVIGALMAITKIVGIMFVVPLIYCSYIKHKHKINKTLILQCITVSIPLALYMLYLQMHVGDWLAFIHAQKVPGFARPGFDFTGDILEQMYAMYQHATIYDMTAFLISLIGVTYVLWSNQLRGQALFNLCSVIPIFISGGLWNSFRMCLAVLTAYLAAVAISRSCLLLKLLILIVAVSMTWVCLIFWLSGSWVFA